MSNDFFRTSLEDELAGHAARNDDLARTLVERHHVRLDTARKIDIFFWSISQTAADHLVAALDAAGFAGAEASPTGETHLPWSVQVSVVLPPADILATAFTERIALLARSSDSQYDGWGTHAGPHTPSS